MEQKIIPTCIKEQIERSIKKFQNEENNESSNSLPVESLPREQILLASAEPYPEIENAIPSMFEVRLIKLNNFSRRGEFSAINTYLYQHFILAEDFPEVANMLRQIAVVEMKHYELLSEAVVKFGGNPNLTDGRGNVWTGRNVLQIRNLRDILLADIKLEEEAIKNYETSTLKTQNQSLANLFLRIAEDEKLHVTALKNLLKTLN